MPVGWLGTIRWRLRTEIHSHGRFSPAQPLVRACTFNRPPSQTVAKLFQAGQAVPCSETGSYTDLCLPVDNANLPPTNFNSRNFSFPPVILCVLYFLNAFISLFSLSFFGRYQFQFFSLIRNPSIDFYLTINPSNQFQFVSRNFPFIDFVSQNHLTYSSLMDNKIFTRLHKENSFCQSSPNLFIFVFQSLSILSSVRGSAHSLFKSILLIQFFAISREKKGNGMCTSAQKERKKKADTADKFFTGEIHR